MSESPRRPILSWCCGILMLVLYYYAGKQWSGQSGTFYIGRSNSVNDGFDASTFGGGTTGEPYFFGGTFILILGAAWMILPQFKRVGMEEPSPLVPLAAAGFGAVALLRWYGDYKEKLAWFESTRQRSVFYGNTEASIFCFLAVIGLTLLAGLYWLRGRKRGIPPPVVLTP